MESDRQLCPAGGYGASEPLHRRQRVFGIVVISSATNVKGSAQYVRTQILALVLGIILYVFFTLVDVDIIAERRELLLIFSAIFILLLFPFGDTRSGNRSWLAFSFLPFSIQPAAVITVFMFGLIVVASEYLGVALQYLFIFVIMAFVGGVSLLWFLGAFAVLLVASPFLWQFLSYDRRSRIWVLFDPRIDPAAQDQRYQMNRSLRALQNGGITGQGLYHGTMVQSGTIPAQHTDLIFSSIGEELGMLGCMAVLILLTAIIIRIIYVGIKSGNYMNRLICVGIAGMLTAPIPSPPPASACRSFPTAAVRSSQCFSPWALYPASICAQRRTAAHGISGLRFQHKRHQTILFERSYQHEGYFNTGCKRSGKARPDDRGI